ncbi:polysaccharide deacetylase family protein [Chryseobacterium limigenitum]|uniref:Peptidoglycan/xylan/chitin deacetylase, PgdA/CDA1 family n=1 Tax=Chryseobacterium limigenitum TaxID=1612149 RepID=A0A1K2IPG3_9FLAO|nr:polysaccharide deacetylase family protein [Chryseobacterium limigenitum]SFZ94271.1 Peptidoglycan/xylan/chitin deacetylase, PgdA/CDA1 family [Chryseobacterium limigenitum]
MKDRIINLLANFAGNDIEKSFPLPYCLSVYHCVSDENLLHLNHIINYKNVKQFEQDLDYLSKYFQFVNWEEFKDFIKGNFKPKKKIALLTFDDGFREFYDVVVPILERKGIYAVNFINPAFIDNKDLMFRSKASLIINEIEKNKDISPEIYNILQFKSDSKSKIKQKILQLNYHQTDTLNKLTRALEINISSFLKEQKPYLSFDQLKSLTQKGFGISSHSWDHPLYNELSLSEKLETTNKTFDYLNINNFLYESFAFPFTDFGVEKSFFDELFKNKNMFCTFGSAGIKLDSVSKNLQRIPMETGKNAETILKKEICYYQLKSIFNKNKIIRK